MNHRSCVARTEWHFVLLWSLVAVTVTSIPYALGAGLATDDRVFGGFVCAVEDGYSYLAKMRQGAEGAWLFHIAYTSEPHPGALFFPFHLMLGKVAALLPGGALTTRMIWVYHVARVAFGFGLLAMVYRFLAALTTSVTIRRLAWLLTTFGGGLGWFLVAIGAPEWLGSLPLDFILPEGFTFLVLYAFPHIALGRTLLLGGLLLLIGGWSKESAGEPSLVKGGVIPGLLWLAMGLIVPFYVGVAWAVTGAAWIGTTIRQRRFSWFTMGTAAVAGLISAPIVAYSLWVFNTYPVYRAWSSQNLILSPHPLHYLVAFGLYLAPALLAVRPAWRSERPAWLALAWVAVVPLLVYLPFNLQRRLVEGAQVPLSFLTAWGLTRLFRLGIETESLRRTLTVTVIVVTFSLTNALLVTGNSLALFDRPHPIYRDAGEVAALDWLDERVAPGDVVLSSYATGNYLPARVTAHAFVGHGPETVDAEQKRELAERFFAPEAESGWRASLLVEYGVDYVFWGPAERALGSFDPDRAPFLDQIYAKRDYEIYATDETN